MSIWMVSYDLRAPGRGYEALHKTLKSVAYAHVLESVWLIETSGPAARIRDVLRDSMDANDGLIVIEFGEQADWAIKGINKPSMDWIQLKRP